MKKKFKRVVSFALAFIVSITCFCFSTFAFSDDNFTVDDVNASCTYDDNPWIDYFLDYVKNYAITHDYGDHYVITQLKSGTITLFTIKEGLSPMLSYDLNSQEFTLSNITNRYSFRSINFNMTTQTVSHSSIRSGSCTGWNITNSEYVGILYSTDDFIYSNGEKLKDKNSAPVPFTLGFSRTLTTSMRRTGLLDGDRYDNNSIEVSVSLTSEFLQRSQEYFDDGTFSTLMTYQYCMFVTPFDPRTYGTKKAIDNALYTYLGKSTYKLTDAYGKIDNTSSSVSSEYDVDFDVVSSVDSSSSADNTSMCPASDSTAVGGGLYSGTYCSGVSPLKYISIGGENTSYQTIDIANIKGCDNLTEQDILFTVVVGKLCPYSNDKLLNSYTASNSQFATFYNELPDNSLHSLWKSSSGSQLYDYYTAVSDGFSFVDYPAFVPLNIDGKDYDTTKPFKDIINSPYDPDTYTDYDGLENDKHYQSKDDYDEHISDKQIANNFALDDFTDIGDLFKTTGSYFKFLTASISVLPSWFLVIFTAWFTIILGLAIVKIALSFVK